MPCISLPENPPSVDYLRECFDHKSGVLTWRRRPRCHYKSDRTWKHALRYTGKVAGYVDTKGYHCVGIDHVTYKVHRIVWALHYGEWPTQPIDHRNGNKGDNSIANLREVTHVVNSHNQSFRSTNRSGIHGVSWNRRSGKWVAQIMADRRKLHLGYFNTKEAAEQARKAADVKYGYSHLHGTVHPTEAPDYADGLPRINNSSGRTGVSFNQRSEKWVASIYKEGASIYLGTFSAFEKAVAARQPAEEKYGVKKERGRVRVSSPPINKE